MHIKYSNNYRVDEKEKRKLMPPYIKKIHVYLGVS